MGSLEISKLKLSISRANVVIEELELKKMERLEDIKRLDAHAELQRIQIKKVQEKLHEIKDS